MMAVFLLCSATTSPGVTTSALGLALGWPRHVLLADCDREPSQCIEAGFLRGTNHGGRGLIPLARLHRDGLAIEEELWQHTVSLTTEQGTKRRFLPGFTSAGAARLFEHVWSDLGQAFGSLDARGVDVIIDAGRIGVSGIPSGLLNVSETVLLCVRSSLRSLAAARIHTVTLQEQLAALPTKRSLAIAVIGADRPYSTSEISAQFGLPCWAAPKWDPKAAAVLSDGATEPRRFLEGSFMGRFRTIAKDLGDRVGTGLDTSEPRKP